MNRKTVEVFYGLMKNGWIDRREDSILWANAQDTEVQEELEDFKEVLEFDIYRTGERLYLIPTQENEWFLKNNMDFRKDIKADSSVKIRDLYLYNYLSIHLIYLFFSGEGTDPLCRDFITKEDWIDTFTQSCKAVESPSFEGENQELEYSENFMQLTTIWLSKTRGDKDSQKFDTQYGIINRILIKFKKDQIFDVDSADKIRPTRKMKDLMPYFLRKDRVAQIHRWIAEVNENATD